MPYTSEPIATITGAIARAQAIIRSSECVGDRSSSPIGLENTMTARSVAACEVVRKVFSQQDIAILQTTRTDLVTGRMYLTTLLAHASGEWISSELPILAEISAPRLFEGALAHARRSSILSLAGLVDNDFEMETFAPTIQPDDRQFRNTQSLSDLKPASGLDGGLPFPKGPTRKRSKAHLAFVRGRACLVCQRGPADAHHLKFAQPSTLGRKVSDEFTVPLCRQHHQDLHRHGNERAWWANLKIDALSVAYELWTESVTQSSLLGSLEPRETKGS